MSDQSREAPFVMPTMTPKLRTIVNRPLVQSLLYDINLLPEQIREAGHWNYMLAVCEHMEAATLQSMERAAVICEAQAESHDEMGNTQADYGALSCAAAIRADAQKEQS